LEEKDILDKLLNPETRDYGFNLLVTHFQERVYLLARKMVIDHDDANDITQDVFIKVYQNLEKFRGDSSLFTWIYRITSNECISFLRKKKIRNFLPWSQSSDNWKSRIDNSPLISGDEIQKKLQKAILTLPEKQRLVFNLKYFDELKYEEIAEITGTSVGGLKASYHLAVKKIEQFLNDH
jgi:RNA polymerase sigma-70 factor (ECF subfamily)